LASKVLAELDVVAEVRLRLDPSELLAVEDDGFVEECVRGLRVLPPEVLLGPVPDPMLFEPGGEPLLALTAALALELHAVRGVDHVGGEQLFDLLAETGIRGGLGVEERPPDLLAGDAELSEHLLAHEDGRELPFARDIQDRAAALPLGDELRELTFHDVEAPRRIAGDAMGVDHEEELLVPMFGVGEAMHVLVGDEGVVEALVGRSVHGVRSQ